MIVENLTYQLASEAQIQILTPPRDQASMKFGSQDGYEFCGPREITIVSSTTDQQFLTFDSNNNEIQVMTNAPEWIGFHEFEAIVSFVNFPKVSQKTSFIVEVICKVQRLVYEPVAPIVYSIGSLPSAVNLSPFIPEPDCYEKADVEVGLLDQKTGEFIPVPPYFPAWLVQTGEITGEVYTEDPDHIGNYTMVVRGQIISETY